MLWYCIYMQPTQYLLFSSQRQHRAAEVSPIRTEKSATPLSDNRRPGKAHKASVKPSELSWLTSKLKSRTSSWNTSFLFDWTSRYLTCLARWCNRPRSRGEMVLGHFWHFHQLRIHLLESRSARQLRRHRKLHGIQSADRLQALEWWPLWQQVLICLREVHRDCCWIIWNMWQVFEKRAKVTSAH